MRPRPSPFVWLLGFAVLACGCGSSAGSAGAKGGAGGSEMGDGGRAGSIGGTGGTGGTGGSAAGGTSGGSGGTSPATPGWNLVAIDTPKRTYLDYVLVPSSGEWSPDAAGMPQLAQWENVTAHEAVRFRRFTPGDVLTPAEIMALLPAVRPSARSLSITAAPYSAAPSPADATTAIQKALDDAAVMAKPGAPVDVLVPTGIFNYSAVLKVGADVHLRRSPEDSGGVLHATNPAQEAVRLAGDRSAALFLRLTYAATTRLTTAQSSGIWVGYDHLGVPFVYDALVVGNEVDTPASAHVFGYAEEGGLWAFNYVHDGYADSYHHTAGSRYCQVVGNRSQTRADRGDDHYAFVSYQSDGDVVHHCAAIANFGRDGHARGLSVVGGGFILLDHNDLDRTNGAGIYLAQENSWHTYGAFDLLIRNNVVRHSNLAGGHDGLLAFSDAPTESHDATSLGAVSNQVRRVTVDGNTFSDTSPGTSNGHGIEIRASVDTGSVTHNVLTGNVAPQIVVKGTNFTTSDNQEQ